MKKSVAKSDYKKEHLGVSAFTLAIAGFFVTLFSPIASFVMFIVSLVFSINQQRKNPNKIGKAGLILSIVGIVLDILFIILLVTVLANFMEQLPTA
jgi:uncharacterized membrane protein